MKYFLLTAALVFGLSACASSGTSGEPEAAPEPVVEAEAALTEEPAEAPAEESVPTETEAQPE